MAHEPAQDTARAAHSRERLRLRVATALAARLSPERTRRATMFERLTVRRLSWDHIVRLHRYLEMVGKLATGIWVAFLASIVLGVHWRQVVEETINSGKPIQRAFMLSILVPTLAFLAARSMIGFARWRLQRELWRRDVERLGAGERDPRLSRLSAPR